MGLFEKDILFNIKKMFIRIYIFCLLVSCALFASAESWDYIRNSGEYYYGIGVAATEDAADKAAMANLVSQIATHVSSDFVQIDDVRNHNGNLDHKSRVLSCVKTYSQTTLTNVEKWGPEGKAPNITVRRFIKKSELARIFDNRIAKAKSMFIIAGECLENKKIDMALQYYYWGYSLIRSVQFPNEVKDESGRVLVDWIPVIINQILSDVTVFFDKRDGDFADLFFLYKGEPVSSLEFSYSDGRTICQGLAKDGRGSIEMLPGYVTDTYHLDIEYEYKSQSRGDAEMESVLGVITPKVFPKAAIKVSSRISNSEVPISLHNGLASNKVNGNITAPTVHTINGKVDNSVSSNSTHDSAIQSELISGIINAINNKRYSDANEYFTIDGLAMFNRLTGYGKVRILDSSNIRYYKGLNDKTVARGLKMSFSFDGRRKKTFVEDVSFTFDKNNKIENVAFGLGDMAESGIFNSKAAWSDDVREIIVSFMENYKTAYSLERLDYLRDIFDDEAVIIVGNVVRKNTANTKPMDGMSISLKGQDVIKYNRYTKDDYITHLSRCFNRNDFINLRFTNHQIQWLEKYNDQTIFAINIRQEYNSSTYADDGYLFLLIDMTKPEEPLIKVRTWQPNEVSIDKLYNAGDFFND